MRTPRNKLQITQGPGGRYSWSMKRPGQRGFVFIGRHYSRRRDLVRHLKGAAFARAMDELYEQIELL